MPITVRVDTAAGVRYTAMSGDITGEQIVETFRPAIEARAPETGMNGLVDMRDVRTLDVSSGAVWELTRMLRAAEPPGIRRRVAIVASSDFVFGMARMFESLASSGGAATEYQVFRDIAEARGWLGLEAER